MKKKLNEIKNLFTGVNKVAFFIYGGVSILLIIISFFLPPAGAIDPSVLKAAAELFAFAALSTVVIGMERGADVKVSRGDTSVSINNPDEKH